MLKGLNTIIVSACLLGIRCRYDGRESGCPGIENVASRFGIIPICPEQLGGLPTPRLPSNIMGGDGFDVLRGIARIIDSSDRDVTDCFMRGAEESLKLASINNAHIAILKDKSPSCGLATPYCEKPNGTGMGITAALFSESGIKIFEMGKGDAFPDEGTLSNLGRG